MADDWDSLPNVAEAPRDTSWDAVPSVGNAGPAPLSEGFFRRAYAGLNHIPRDIVDNFMEGVHTAINAPGQIIGTGDRRPVGMDDLGPKIEEQLHAAGFEPEAAKSETARVLRTLQRQQGQTGLIFGPLQAIASPLLGPVRSLISRPLEESQGIPKEISEPLMMAAGAALGLRAQLTRIKLDAAGRVKAEPIGEPPDAIDFHNAADKIIEGEFTVIEPPKQLAPPERIVGAAYKVGDRVFQAPIHALAKEEAMKALGLTKESELIDRQAGSNFSERHTAHEKNSQGFVTSTGRFVDRTEADAIAKTQDQIKSGVQSRLGGANAEDIEMGPPPEVTTQPLQRKVLERDSSGRPTRTEPFKRGTADAIVENLRRLWDEDGIHPAEVARDVENDPFLRNELTAPPASFVLYHGSPHDFSAVDLSKIGTGEGAQAFGHGFYGAQNIDVAAGYRNKLSTGNLSDPNDVASNYLRSLSDRQTAIESLRDNANNFAVGDATSPEVLRHAADLLEAGVVPKSPGTLYQLRIHANPEHFLDWDAPLAEQSEQVKAALRNLGYDPDSYALPDGRLAPRLGGPKGSDIAKTFGKSPDETAQILKDAGIPGIKYLDQGSRNLGLRYEVAQKYDGTFDLINHRGDIETVVGNFKSRDAAEAEREKVTPKESSNFVMFSDKDIEITHKNGLALQDAKEIVAEVDKGFGAPPRSANLSPIALPRTMYPQQPASSAVAPPPGGAPPPPQGPSPPQIGAPPPPGAPPFVGINPPLAPTPQPRAPFFTYDDRNAFVKAFSRAIKTWQETFQPELVSDKALQADPFFAEYKSASQNLKDQIVHNAEDNYQYWRTQSEADRLRYLRSVESGMVPTQWQGRADIHRQILQEAHKMEVQAGSKADYFENYFPHIWESPLQARNWVEGQTAQFGPTWFQKERTFKAIQDGLDAGLRLKSTNPEELITQRLFSTADMLERMSLIDHMKDMGLAIQVEQARAERAQRIAIAQALGFPIDVTTVGRDLSAEGWEPINAPDRQQWFIAPDIRPLWENAMRAQGLWGNEGNLGSTFRGWMAFKSTWVPIKLALSAFHPLHVAHINMTGHIVQAVKEASHGEFGDALKQLGDILYDPIAAAVPKLTHEGRFAREAWLVPEDARTPLETAMVKTMEEGGLVANQSEQLMIDSQRKLEEAWDKQQWFRMAPQLVREGIRRMGAPIFEHWIPNLKVAAYLRDAADFMSQHPEIIDDEVQRRVALRTIAKSIENRYGEMFYGGLFWNRALKDAGIGSFLSLGWNVGFVREFGGAAVGPLARGVRNVQRPPTQTEETIYKAQSKGAYAMTYMAGAMLINGIITYASTGQDPEGSDWAFPRNGRNNPDGTPHRLTNMFYTRELPMVEKHIQSAGSIVGGVADTLYGKLVIGPIVELMRNRDYYGNEIWGEGNPLYKRGQQVVQHVFGEQFSPMSVAGAQQAMKSGGGWDEAALAMLGFGPAPSYANKTATQNLVEHLFGKFVAPEAKPQEMGAQAKDRGDIRSEILLAQQRGDSAAVQAGSQKWLKTGGSRQGLSNILLHIPPDVSMFRALPETAQQQVMTQGPPEETGKYRPYLKSNIANRVADLQVDALAASGAGDTAGAERIAGEIKATLSEAVASGRITNLAEFQRSVQQGMMFRLMPQAAAEKGDTARQKRLLAVPP